MRIAYGTESSLTVKSFPLKQYDLFNATVDTIDQYFDKEVYKQLLAIGNDKILHLTVANLTYTATCYNIYYVTKGANDTHIPNADIGDNLTVLDLSIDCFVQRCDMNIYYNTTKDRFEQVFKKHPNKELCVPVDWSLLQTNNGTAITDTMITKANFDLIWDTLRNGVDNINISFRVSGWGRCNPLYIWACEQDGWRKLQFLASEPIGDGTNFIGTLGLAYYEIKYNIASGAWANIVKKSITPVMSQAEYNALQPKDANVIYYTV